ncbi:hypothetical protein [Moraxella osloensis]|nr:hypothetical protein [Moraxella osloensis]
MAYVSGICFIVFLGVTVFLQLSGHGIPALWFVVVFWAMALMDRD